MRVLAEIPSRTSPDLPAGTLRRRDLDAFERLLDGLAGARTTLITGAATGKRVAAIGLATAAAAGGLRTALLECDLVEPSLADSLGLATAPGLHEYLRGDAEVEGMLKPVVLTGPGSAEATEPLVCVVAGRPASDGAYLLASERFRHAAAGLRDAYELLVIDGPPSGRDDGSLTMVADAADATVVCVGRSEPRPQLAVPVTGLLVQA